LPPLSTNTRHGGNQISIFIVDWGGRRRRSRWLEHRSYHRRFPARERDRMQRRYEQGKRIATASWPRALPPKPVTIWWTEKWIKEKWRKIKIRVKRRRSSFFVLSLPYLISTVFPIKISLNQFLTGLEPLSLLNQFLLRNGLVIKLKPLSGLVLMIWLTVHTPI